MSTLEYPPAQPTAPWRWVGWILVAFLVVLLLCLTGCAHRPKVHRAPSHAKLAAAATKLTKAVTAAQETNRGVSAQLAAARKSHVVEVQRTAAIAPRLEVLERDLPPAFRPAVVSLRGEVAALQEQQRQTSASFEQAAQQQGILTGQLEEATAAKNEVAQLTPAYYAEVEALAQRATEAEAGWAKTSRELLGYKLRSIGFWISSGLGLLAVGVLVFFYFTGRLALNLR